MKRKSKICLLPVLTALLLAGLPLSLSAQESGSGEAPARENWLGPLAPFWTWDAETFERETRPANFRWMEPGTSARAAPLNGTLFGRPVYEAVVRFQNGQPHSFQGSYFNRGDSDRMLSEADFQALVRELTQTISARVRQQPMPGNNQSRRAGVRDDSLVWQLPTHRFELSFSFTPPRREGGVSVPFRAEFIQLSVSKFAPGDIPAHMQTRVNVFEIRANVQRNDAGDVWIANVPMVDQGPKGYCAAATAERVMRYFGQDVDQHQIAQLANTTAQGGTSYDQFRTALEVIGRQYNFSFNRHIDWSFRDFQSGIDHYNRVARRHGRPEIHLPRAGVIDVGAIYSAMNPETLVESRLNRRADFNRFQERIQRYVNAGAPLIWGVTLGIIPEPGIPQNAGGHLRLIIGYNLETEEILFSDSWGRGHELKRMPIAHAWAITTALYSLEPRGLRL